MLQERLVVKLALVTHACSPRNSQQYSPTPHLDRIEIPIIALLVFQSLRVYTADVVHCAVICLHCFRLMSILKAFCDSALTSSVTISRVHQSVDCPFVMRLVYCRTGMSSINQSNYTWVISLSRSQRHCLMC